MKTAFLVSLFFTSISWGAVLKTTPLFFEMNTEHFSYDSSINGFSINQLTFSRRLGSDYAFLEGRGSIDSAYLIHPYFLKNGKNEASIQYKLNDGAKKDKGPNLGIGVAESPLDNQFYPTTLLSLQLSPDVKKASTFKIEFNWPHVIPEWSWVKGTKIENNEANRKSLYAEHAKIRQALRDPKQNQALKEKVLKSSHEFLQASKLMGKNNNFVEEFFEGAKNLETTDSYGGKWTLTFQEPKKESEVKLHIFAGGTLASLSERMVFNGQRKKVEGSKGRGGEAYKINLIADIWYRKAADGQWVVDAIFPDSGSHGGEYY